jgi:hypothetical protein
MSIVQNDIRQIHAAEMTAINEIINTTETPERFQKINGEFREKYGMDLGFEQPEIINPDSNFVVVTYWWGRTVPNINTARPCTAFFEIMLRRIIKLTINFLNTLQTTNQSIPENVYNHLETYITKLSDYKKELNQKSTQYLNMIYDFCNIKKAGDRHGEKLFEALDKCKLMDKIPQNFEFKTQTEVAYLLHILFTLSLKMVKPQIKKLWENKLKIIKLKADTELIKDTISLEEKRAVKQQIKDLQFAEKQIMLEIGARNRVKLTNEDLILDKSSTNEAVNKFPEYIGKSVMDILHEELRFVKPLKFEEMIEQWKGECRKFGCNFLAVEYPEFTKPGGYQLAINAKPLFIRKALELCAPRNVLYIDGDMYIKHYPSIFDLKDVDFMARGWWMDPRSSYKMDESITYDPYTFETSGGTMFFSQSNESKILLNKWAIEASTLRQKGRADDRVLSLIFNTYKLLCNMKIIQLPVNYLWLTLDYDERLFEGEYYDYNMAKMKDAIFIEHPECLTTEETAGGSGAASDRSAMYATFLEETNPVSEQFHEYLVFPTEAETDGFKDYLDFMSTIYYIDDGNEILYKKRLVTPGSVPSKNEQPIYVTSYKDKFGNKPRKTEDGLTPNQLSEINYKKSEEIDPDVLGGLRRDNNILVFDQDDSEITSEMIIPFIIKMLKNNFTFIYNPLGADGYSTAIYTRLITESNNLYKGLDLVLNPTITGFDFTDFFRPIINLNQPILFRPGNRVLVDFLSMHASLGEVSDALNYGSYEFMSNVRVGYVKEPRQPRSSVQQSIEQRGGTNINMDTMFDEYEVGLELMNGISQENLQPAVGGRKRKYTKRRKNKRKSIKKSKRSRK